uniref:Polyketide synthase n=1 Tax=Racemicystis crocea TaxID=1707966 RepID=A0A3S5GYN6_9BACT|nr:polyketide synthase [Racemicystis crocea]
MNAIDEYRSRLQKAAITIKDLSSKLEAIQSRMGEPIAIVGMACRFPGGGDDPEAFFRVLEGGVDAVRKIPEERWTAEALAGGRPEVQWAALLDAVDGFDAAFFGISPREAARLDPQQRLLLEVAWEALESAGARADRLLGSRTGVFVGMCSADYQMRVREAEPLDVYSATGTMFSTAAGRLSYVFGLQGPCMTIDTACSSSLVAAHLACQSLRRGESDLALAGGVNLLLDATTMRMLEKTQALSSDGRCRAFDAGANGFVRGEGCGVVVLKRLSDAERDGDPILAVIRGSAVNQDGKSTGLTAPNVLSQQDLLKRALESARLSAEDIDYVETHGTGTSLGDPIEFEALRAALGKPRADGSRCVLGAVKTNVGHLEAAAGMAGLIKAVLCLQHEAIPRNLHFETLNPRMSLTGTPFVIPTETAPWKANGKARHVGVSSFGISGTNAHVILEEAPRRQTAAPLGKEATSYLLPLSGRSPEALVALARSYRETLSASEASLHDIAFTASARRSHHEHRVAVTGSSKQEMALALEAFARGEAPTVLQKGRAPLDGRARVVFVFPGQGSQWLGMGRTLLSEEPAFRKAIEACDEAIRQESGYSVIEELRADEAHSRLGEIDVVQPVLFAIEVALSALWRSWGVEPDAVVGHSMGEVAAAHVAGALTLEDAAKIICRRSRLLKRVSGQGAMALVELTLKQAQEALAGYEDRLSVAVNNGPRAAVLAGDPAALEEVLVKLEGKGVFCRRVKVDVASHSPQMDPLRGELLTALGRITPRATQLAMRSTVTGEPLCGEELSAGYWADNLRQPVLFSQATQKLIDEGHTLFLEMSPHPILLPSVEENLRERGRGGVAIASLRRQSEERRCLLDALGALYVHGCDVNWDRIYPEGGRVVPLPAYPWQRERYWVAEPRRGALAGTAHVRRRRSDGHPFLGPSFTTSTQPGTRFWEITINPGEIAYLSEHRIQGAIVLPGAVYVEIVLAAAPQILGEKPFVVDDLVFSRAMVLHEDTTQAAELAIAHEGSGEWSFRLSSLSPREQVEEGAEPTWTLHASGRIRQEERERVAALREPLEAIRSRCVTEVERESYYEAQRARGIELGAVFQGIAQAWQGKEEALARLDPWPRLPGGAGAYRVHPALLDAGLQVLGAALWNTESADDSPRVLSAVRRLRCHAQPVGEVWSHARLRAGSGPGTELDEGYVTLLDHEGCALVEIEGIRVERLERPRDGQNAEEPAPFLSQAWHLTEPLPAPVAQAKAGKWLLLAEATRLSDDLESILSAHGEGVVRVEAQGSRGAEKPGVEVVDPASPEAFQRLLARAFGDGAACRGVIDLWGVEANAAWTMASLDAAQTRGCGGALHLVQALALAGFRDMPRLFLITRGTQSVDEEPSDIDIAQASLWGLGRTIASEHPELSCSRVDLDPRGFIGEAEILAREILADHREEEIALRQERRYVGRLGRVSPAWAQQATRNVTDTVVKADATYMITGGLGGLGLLAAQWLAGEGAQHILLVGRSGVTAEAQEKAIADLRAAGVEVVVARGDIADPSELARVLREAEDRMPPLRGIFHTAGVLEDGALLHQDMRRFRAVFAPKVLGAWNLHVATQRTPLDFFVLYSSVAGLFGAPGLGNYVAANVFLDALAHHRRRLGLPALSVDWGFFAGVGMGIKAEREGRVMQRGIRSFTPEEGRALFHRLLRLDTAQVGVVSYDARQWVGFYPQAARSLRLSPLVQESRTMARAASRPELQSALRKAAPAERRQLIEPFVREQVAAVLRLDAARIDPSMPLRSLGIDSIMGLELRNRLESGLGLQLSATLVWTYPTVAALSEHLAGELGPREEGPLLALVALEETSAPSSADASMDDELLAAFDHSLRRIENRVKP